MTGPASRPVRAVLIVEDLDFGGTQRYVAHLATHLDRGALAPEVWTLRGGGAFRDSVMASGTPVVDLTRARRVGPVAIVRLALRLLRDRPDVVYTLTVLPCIWARLLAGILGIPVVSGYRNDRPQQHERLLGRFSHQIIANAERLKVVLVNELGIDPARVAVVPNGVDTEAFQPPAEPSVEPLIVCVARRVPRKDLPTLLAAFERVRKRLPDARLVIMGDGPVGLPGMDNLELRSGSDEVQALLHRGAVFALSSVDEGAPNAILEAMACGLPVVATQVGGVPELVDDGVSGLLVPPRNPEALADAVLSVLSDSNCRAAMGKAGRVRVCERFSLTRMAERTGMILVDAARGDFA